MRYQLVNLSKGADSEKWLNEHADKGYRIIHIIQPSTATAPCTHYHAVAIMEHSSAVHRGPGFWAVLAVLMGLCGIALGWLKAKGY